MKKLKFAKLFNVFLVFFMVVSLINPVHVHAEDYTLTTDKETYTWGDPIMVDANAGNWIGLYDVGATPGEALSYYYVYVNAGTPQNILAGEGNAAMVLTPGDYQVMLFEDGGYTVVDTKNITIKDVADAETSLVTDKTEYQYGEVTKITAVNKAANAWVGVYDGTHSESTDFGSNLMAAKHRGRWYYTANYTDVTYKLPVGDYTVVLFKNGGYDVAQIQHISVKGTKLISTNKTEYYWGEEPILVTVVGRENPGEKDWVGLYNILETPASGGPVSKYWAYASDVKGTKDLVKDYEYQAEVSSGIYTLYLLADDGYEVIDYTTITIWPGIASVDEEQAPTCEKDGWRKVTLTDDTKKTITAEQDATLKSLGGHTYPEKWVFDGKDRQTHSKTCTVCATETKCTCEEGTLTEVCTFDGVVTEEATTEKDGLMTYTCTVCGGSYTEIITKKEVAEVKVTKVATCEQPGVETTYYTDGTTSEKVIPAVGHEYETEWHYASDSDEHYRACVKCANEEECKCVNASITEECNYKAGKLVDGKVDLTCTVCKGVKEHYILKTDKTEYKFGEAINVSINVSEYYPNYTDSDWFALYKVGDTYGPHNPSWFWGYLSSSKDKLANFNIFDYDVRSTNPDMTAARKAQFVAGEYYVVLMANDGYTPITATPTFKITAEVIGGKGVEPTCEVDGSEELVYSDKTTVISTATHKTVVYENGEVISDVDVVREDLKATGHSYPEKWSYNGETLQTHSKVCTKCNDECGCKEHTLTEKCTFDEGKVTKEPKPGEDGTKVYTCTVCGGTKTEILTVKVVEKVEITTKPTCDNPGVETTTYTDGTTSEKVLPSLGHDYPETWTYDASSKSHKKVCVNDASHVQSEKCNFVRLADNVGENEVTYECSVCTGSYTNKLIKTDKDVYAFGEPILVSTDYNAANAWVGIYKPGETFNPDAGGKASIFWYYIHEVDATQPVDIRLQRDENGRSGEFTAGDYTIVLFKDGNYNAYSHVDIKITNIETGKERFEPTCEKDGKIVISYSDGTTKTITAAQDDTLKAINHKYPEKWSFVSVDTRTHEKVCVNCNAECGCEEAVLTESCTFDKGVITTPASGNTAGVMTYTCTVCGGKYTESFYNKEVKEEIVVVEPTCETTGLKKTVYTDDSYIETVIPMLGHTYGEWKFDEETHKHTKTCINDKKLDHVKVEDCTFDKGVSNDDGETTYTCEVCKGSYTVGLLIVKDKDINIGEPLYVTANCANDGSWVGLYGINDTYDPNRTGGVVSFYWYYVVGEGNNRNGVEVNLLDFRNTDRYDSLTTGAYKVVLFGDGGYSNVLSEVVVNITSQTDETKYGMKLNGKDVANKSTVEFNEKEIEDVVVNVTADGIVGDSWVGIYYGKISANGDASSVPTSNYWYWVDAKEGQENRNGVDVKLGDYIDLYAGDYTVAVFGDAGYSNIRHIAYFSIVKTTTFEEILMQPTCNDWGQKYVIYEDGTDDLIPIEPLGHDVTGTLTFDAEHKEHYDTCSRCGKVAEECTFDEGVVEGNVKTYTCEVCKGTYTETISGPTQPEVPSNPTVDKVNRVFGNTRYETSYGIADTMRELNNDKTFDSIIIASGKNFADALAGSYLAAKKNAPILMTDGKNSTAIKTYIKNNVTAGGTVYILGGTAAVSDKVLSGLTGYTVKRLAGKDRYATNLEILKEAGVTNEEIIVATGTGFADSLSASASGKPILLVGKKLSKEQKAYLASVQTQQYYVIGGTSAVSAALAKEVEAYGAVKRIGGSTRYQTSVMVAETFFNDATSAVVAYGRNYPDGLCGGPLAYTLRAPLILTENGKEADAASYTKARNIKVGIMLGGSGLVSDKTTQKIFGLASANEIVVKK